jgi:hypothetical protein
LFDKDVSKRPSAGVVLSSLRAINQKLLIPTLNFDSLSHYHSPMSLKIQKILFTHSQIEGFLFLLEKILLI